MCLITGLAVAALAGIGAGVFETISGQQQASASQSQAEYMSALSKQQSAVAEKRAQNIEEQGDQDRLQLRNSMLAKKGEARASYGAAGVTLGTGSAADYEADIADAYDLDKKNLNYDIASRAWEARVQGTNALNQSKLYDMQADAYGTQKTTSLIGGIFNTVGQAGSGSASVIRGWNESNKLLKTNNSNSGSLFSSNYTYGG